MLRILNLCFFCFIVSGTCFAGDQFFNNPIRFFGSYKTNQGCHGCKEVLNIPIHKHGNMQGKKEQGDNIKLFVFVMPGKRLSAEAVRTAKTFQILHPEVAVRGIIIEKLQGWINTLLNNKYLFDRTFPFYYEPGLNTAIEFHITRIPTFVFVYKDKIIKVSGQPDLNKIYKDKVER